ncbi:MAG: YtpR family tRNA-binding protein [Solirubrobacteraceae bacterium]
MRVPLHWLHAYCHPPLDAPALAERLAMTGTEVERIEHHGVRALEHFVVGRVLERRRHPDADRLSVCMVDVGGSTPSQIICGAPNVKAGQLVAVAKPGAVMPDGTTLDKAKLRGIESNGMILAEDELAIGTEHAGILVLDEAQDQAHDEDEVRERGRLQPGTPLEQALPISTDVLVLEVTPNRPDCLGIYGVAREVHAATGGRLESPPWAEDPGDQGDQGGHGGDHGDHGDQGNPTNTGNRGNRGNLGNPASPSDPADPSEPGADPGTIARPGATTPGQPAAPERAQDSYEPAPTATLGGVRITVECPDLCPRFTARLFEQVTIGPSPSWLKARLMAAGQRPISNVVDITNYAMLLTGQPLHAFDLDRVAGGILRVRRASEGERIETLDGQARTLDEQMVLIADDDGPTSIAGVMGGARSEVAPETTRVLMEVACWNGPNIHRTSLKLGLRSEAGARFEKQLQPEQALQAQAVATKLMLELCGARLIRGTIDLGGPGPRLQTIRLRDARIANMLGAPIARERSAQLLRALEFGTVDADDGLDVRVPAFRRADVTREADLIEEVARLDGLEKLPATLPAMRHAVRASAAGHNAAAQEGAEDHIGEDPGEDRTGEDHTAEDHVARGQDPGGRLTPRQRLRRRAADALTAQGLHEIVGWSFVGPELADRLRLGQQHDRRQAVELENPMSAEQSRLRTTLLGSLLDVARRNRSRGAGMLRLFESGSVYLPTGDASLPREPHHVAALLIGSVAPPTWRDPEPRAADFFAAKGVLHGLLDTLRAPWSVERTSEPFLHPGRAARILLRGEPAGWVGEIHPLVAAAWELGETVAGFELDLDALPDPPSGSYVDLTSFPEVREDLAVVVGEQITAARVLAVARRAGAPLLARAEVFDVYRDPERLGAGNVSLALALSYRASDRTLTDEEVAAQRQAIVAALDEELGGRIRAA